ncbi:hypothetical protein ACFVZ3_21895 [Kitasatospora purpeofusca]
MTDDVQADYRAAAEWKHGRPPAPARWVVAYAATVTGLLLCIALLIITNL